MDQRTARFSGSSWSAANACQRDAVLAPAVQLELARQVRSWLDWPESDGPCPPSIRRRGLRARDRLVTSNLRLVVALVNKYQHLWRGDPARRDDLIQDATIALMRGIEKFDPSKGYQFSTYAWWWIRQGITRNFDNTIRLPTSLLEDQTRLNKLISTFIASNGRRPNIAWLCAMTGFTRKRVHNAIVIGTAQLFSLDSLLPSGDGTFAETVPAPQRDIHQAIDDQSRREHLEGLLNTLSPEDRQLVEDVFFDDLTHRQAGAARGKSKAWTSARIRRLLNQLQAAAAA